MNRGLANGHQSSHQNHGYTVNQSQYGNTDIEAASDHAFNNTQNSSRVGLRQSPHENLARINVSSEPNRRRRTSMSDTGVSNLRTPAMTQRTRIDRAKQIAYQSLLGVSVLGLLGCSHYASYLYGQESVSDSNVPPTLLELNNTTWSYFLNKRCTTPAANAPLFEYLNTNVCSSYATEYDRSQANQLRLKRLPLALAMKLVHEQDLALTKLRHLVAESLYSSNISNTPTEVYDDAFMPLPSVDYLNTTISLLDNHLGRYITKASLQERIVKGNQVADLSQLKVQLLPYLDSSTGDQNIDGIFSVVQLVDDIRNRESLGQLSGDKLAAVNAIIQAHNPAIDSVYYAQSVINTIEFQQRSFIMYAGNTLNDPSDGDRLYDIYAAELDSARITSSLFSSQENCFSPTHVLDSTLLLYAIHYAVNGNLQAASLLVKQMVDWPDLIAHYTNLTQIEKSEFLDFVQSESGLIGYLTSQKSQINFTDLAQSEILNANLESLYVNRSLQYVMPSPGLFFKPSVSSGSTAYTNQSYENYCIFVSELITALDALMQKKSGEVLIDRLQADTALSLSEMVNVGLTALSKLGSSKRFERLSGLQLSLLQNYSFNQLNDTLKPYAPKELITDITSNAPHRTVVKLATGASIVFNAQGMGEKFSLDPAVQCFLTAYKGSYLLREALFFLKGIDTTPYQINISINLTVLGQTQQATFESMKINIKAFDSPKTLMQVLIHEFSHNVANGMRYLGTHGFFMPLVGSSHDTSHTSTMAHFLGETYQDEFFMDIELNDYANNIIHCGVYNDRRSLFIKIFDSLQRNDPHEAVNTFLQLDASLSVRTIEQEPQSRNNSDQLGRLYDNTVNLREFALRMILYVVGYGHQLIAKNLPVGNNYKATIDGFLTSIQSNSDIDGVIVENAKQFTGVS